MSDPRWNEVRQLFFDLHELPAEQRSQCLDEACGTRPRLREEVETLLAAHDAEGDEQVTIFRLLDGSEEALGDETSLATVGSYRLLEVLGRGGMGTVFRARRDDETFDKEVAIKVINPEIATPLFLQHFRRERQILARLEHPGIARLLDGGLTEDGRPYFVMELVRGEAIDKYCDEHQLHLMPRLHLFQQVLDAVHFAHQNLVLHRDLKPANILVDQAGRPRLLDFGIAEPLVEPSTSEPPAADSRAAGPRPMTPYYSSPEQISGDPLSTASDVYSLGVVLQRLLRRQTLRGDLDSIVVKALSQRPDQRYASAAQLADDLNRYHDGFPVHAHPGSAPYRLSRFVQRNRLAVMASAFFVATLMVLVGFLLVQRADLLRQTQRAKTIAELFTNLIDRANPARNRGDEVTVTEILDQGRREVESIRRDPGTQAALLRVLGAAYRSLGRYEEAIGLQRRALSLHQDFAPRDELEEGLAWGELGWAFFEQLRFEQAESALREGLRLLRRVSNVEAPVLARHLRWLGRTVEGLERFDEAERLYAEAMRLLRGSEEEELAHLLRARAILEQQRGQPEAAEQLLLQALETLGRARETRLDQMFPLFLTDLGQVQRRLDKLAEAEKQFREALRIQLLIHHQDHPYIATTLTYLGNLMRKQGSLDEAQEHLEGALKIRLATLSPDHPKIANALTNLGNVARSRRDHELAEELYTRAVNLLETRQPAMTADYTTALINLGSILAESDREEEGRALQERALELRKEAYGPRNLAVARTLNTMAEVARRGKDHERASKLYLEAIDIAKEALGPEHGTVAVFLSNLALNHQGAGAFEQAEALFSQALSIFARAYGDSHVETLKAERSLIFSWLESGDDEQVVARAESVLERCEKRSLQGRVPVEVEFAWQASLARQGRLDAVRDRLGPAYLKLVEVLGEDASRVKLARQILLTLGWVETADDGMSLVRPSLPPPNQASPSSPPAS